MADKGPKDGDAANPDGAESRVALFARPFIVVRPQRQTLPFVFAFPHSGRLYPDEFVAQSRLGPLGLRRSEDAYVDTLLAKTAERLGAPLIAARFPRAYLDVNRAPGELDAAMFDGALTLSVDTPGPRVQAGLGVIPRIVRDGAEIYRGKLAADEAAQRLTRLYRPYHAALLGLVEETHAGFGAAVILDCHSMPSAAASPDIVLGDRYGVAAGAAVTTRAQQAFERQGFSVVRNVPYAGGFTTQLYGRPARGIHALQIEINRALYLDEDRIAPGPHFAAVGARLATALSELTAQSFAPLKEKPLPWAAE